MALSGDSEDVKANPNHNRFNFLQFVLIPHIQVKGPVCKSWQTHNTPIYIFQWPNYLFRVVLFIFQFEMHLFLLLLSHLRITFQFHCTAMIKTFSSVKFIYSLVSTALMSQHLQLSHNKLQPDDTNGVEMPDISEKRLVIYL